MGKCLTNKEFIKRAKLVHGSRYNYSCVDYKMSHLPIKIICSNHGEFEQAPRDHLQGCGCRDCGYIKNAINATKTTTNFIKEALKVHGNKYDYSRSIYKNSKTPIEVVCDKHGSFYPTPSNHLNGGVCRDCGYIIVGNKQRLSKGEFVAKACKIHGDKYSYSEFEYINYKIPGDILCNKHGKYFSQAPGNHIGAQKQGCPDCGKEIAAESHRYSTKEFIELAIKKHGGRYNYSKVDYHHNEENVIIICTKHGEFKQIPGNHLQGHGCNDCGRESTIKASTYTQQDWIKMAINVHGNKYNYSKTKYIIGSQNVVITCNNNNHGDFEQKPCDHINSKAGCPKCAIELTESRGEKEIEKQLIKSFGWIKFKDFKRQIRCIRIKGISRPLELDFYFPILKIAIEYQGCQHKQFVPFMHRTIENFHKRLEYDQLKRDWCKKRGIKLIEIWEGVDYHPRNSLNKVPSIILKEIGYNPNRLTEIIFSGNVIPMGEQLKLAL